MSFSSCISDASFGPAVRGCRGDFDFTLKFEKIFLSIIPTSVFLAISLPRLVYLTRRPTIIRGLVLRSIKSASLVAYLILQLTLLGFTAARSTKFSDLFISSSVLHVLSALCMLVLSHLEHARSTRPSILLSSYLFLTILFDVVQVRTLWLASTTHDEAVITRLMTAALALKGAISLLESQPKTRWLLLTGRDPGKSRSPEETTGIYGLGAYLWLNRLFFEGWRKVITMADLYPLDSSMAAEALEERLSSIMSGRSTEHPRGQKFGLGKALAKSLAVALLTPVGPRVALIGFTFCQPFLINSVLSYLEEPSGTRDRNVGYGLIGATVLIYLGRTLSEAFYWYFHERSLWMARGALASAIYKKATRAKIHVADDSAALTLMSTDVERIRQGMISVHELWANPIEIAIASFLLERSLGISFLAPIIVVLLCAVVVAGVATFTGQRQKDWMQKIEARVGMTANVIANMKNLRISGLALPIQRIIQSQRLDELMVGQKFRMVLCWSVVLAHAPYYLSPVFTFTWTSQTLTVTRMFTSFSYLALLCTPVTDLFQCVPSVIAGVTCLGRIQAFLEADAREDFRLAHPELSSSEKPPAPSGDATTPIVSISHGTFGWEKDKPSLSGMSLAISPCQLTMIVGPIASGKSTLCKVLLGEAPVFDGQVILGGPSSSRRIVGYCDQSPFLSNDSVKHNILGFAPMDQARYDEVLEASMLQADLATLPQGGDTKIGSNGISLSGGQKQRVAVARALYLDTDFFVFDDVLSGLDADTEEHVFSRVFGPEGLLKRRKATAVLCTHSIRHLPSADHIVAVGADGTIVEQGRFDDLVANQKYIHSLGVKAKTSSDSESQRSSKIVQENTTLPRVKTAADQQQANAATTKEQNVARVNGDRAVYKHYMHSIGFWPLPFFVLSAVAYGFFYNWMTVWIDIWSAGISAPINHRSNSFYLGLFALFQASGLLSMFVNVWVCIKWIINRSGATLHKAALHTVVNAPLRFFTTTDAGVVTNLFSQDMTLIDGELPIALVNVLLSVFICLGMAAVVATASPYVAIVYPFLALVLWVIQKFYLRTSKQLRLLDLEAKSPLYTHFLDTIKGLATFRAFGWLDESMAKNNRLLDDSQRPAYLLAMIQRWLAFVLNCVVTVLAVAVVAMGTQLAAPGSSHAGLTGASLVTLMNFGGNLTWLLRCYTLLETSLGAINRLKTFSDTVRPESQEGEDVNPDESWPHRGEIVIQGVSASYSDVTGSQHADMNNSDSESKQSDPTLDNMQHQHHRLALRELNITIASGEKVAICGRSGSGKSSTLLLLLRLLDPCAPKSPSPGLGKDDDDNKNIIRIDDTPLHKIDRHVLRQRLIAVPQEAVFLPDGSAFRDNLDPLGIASDAECRSVLETVGLGEFVRDRGGLAAGMEAETLSQGQKQLFGLGRAILRRRGRPEQDRGVLLLDEVSSSVDVDTDRAMQAVIQREFAGYTIVMVSHRLEMVMDFDRVLVMDQGAVAETGNPRALAATEGSRFRELCVVSSTGSGQG